MAQDNDHSVSEIRHRTPDGESGPTRHPHNDAAYRFAQAAFAGSVALDLETTLHLAPGWAEGNPVLGRTRAQQIGMSVGLGLLTLWQAHRLESEGHTRAAKIFLWFGATLHSSAASYNLTRPPLPTP